MTVLPLRGARAASAPAFGRNRLFWKLFLGFWSTLLAAGLAVGTAVWFYQQQAMSGAEPVLLAGPRAEMLLRSASATLHYGGVPALRALLADEQALAEPGDAPRLFAIDDAGRDLLGRPVPEAALTQARARLTAPGDDGSPRRRPRGARSVLSAEDKAFLLFVAAAPAKESTSKTAEAREARPGARGAPATRHARLDPLAAITVGLVASLAFSGLLAWYLTRPVRHLRAAFAAVADGRLETRVSARIGRRVDEIAALGQDFDLMAERLQKLMTSQRRLLHDISHELRSPLARLQAAIGLLRQQPEREAAMLERIEREAHRLDSLVGELLTLARLEAGAVADASVRTVDLAEVLEPVVDDSRFEAQAKGRDVRFELPGGAGEDRERWLLVETRGDWLQRGLENVVRNAIRHTAAGTAVELALRPTGGRRVTIAISDRGPGLADHELEEIFEPFKRGRETTGECGYGLGLAIARRVIAAHGGSIEASNREGGGLVVSIELPLSTEEELS
jgi:two-component system OmpR family sensor kinase